MAYSNAYYVSNDTALGAGFWQFHIGGKEKNRFKAVLSITILSVAVVLGFFLSKSYGMYGVLLPITTGLLINSLVMLYYFKKVFNLTVGIFLKDTFLKPNRQYRFGRFGFLVASGICGYSYLVCPFNRHK